MRSSVAMCTYNGARFLPEQLRSLLEQERLPSQVVVCDDKSQDDTAALLEAFVVDAAALGVRVDLHLNPQNLGYVRNFEKALGLCDGDVIFLCDQDDVWHTSKLGTYLKLFEQDPALAVVHSDAQLVDAARRPLGHGLFEVLEVTASERQQMNNGEAFEVLLRRNIVTGATMAFRRELVDVALPMEETWVHDEWLAMVAATRQGGFRCLDWESIQYRQHGDNQIGASKRTLAQRLKGMEIGRRAFIARMVERYRQLYKRSLQGSWMEPAQLDLLSRRIAHGQVRSTIKAGLRNWDAVIREVRNGNYWRFSHGLRSVVVDLLGRP